MKMVVQGRWSAASGRGDGSQSKDSSHAALPRSPLPACLHMQHRELEVVLRSDPSSGPHQVVIQSPPPALQQLQQRGHPRTRQQHRDLGIRRPQGRPGQRRCHRPAPSTGRGCAAAAEPAGAGAAAGAGAVTGLGGQGIQRGFIQGLVGPPGTEEGAQPLALSLLLIQLQGRAGEGTVCVRVRVCVCMGVGVGTCVCLCLCVCVCVCVWGGIGGVLFFGGKGRLCLPAGAPPAGVRAPQRTCTSTSSVISPRCPTSCRPRATRQASRSHRQATSASYLRRRAGGGFVSGSGAGAGA